jgi:hypothetical protein
VRSYCEKHTRYASGCADCLAAARVYRESRQRGETNKRAAKSQLRALLFERMTKIALRLEGKES